MGPQADAVLDEPATEQSEESAMLASFADDAPLPESTTTPTDGEPASATPEETPPSTSEQVPEQSTTSAPDGTGDLASVLQRLTALETISKKSADGLAGRLGSIEHWVRSRQAETPDGKPVTVSAEDFAELKEEFPMLADMQVRAFNKVLEKFKGTGVSADVLQSVVKESRDAAEQAADQRYRQTRQTQFNEEITDLHENWVDIVGLPEVDNGPPPDTEYRRWLATQPEAYRERVLRSYSAVVVGRSIDKFLAWQAEQQPKALPKQVGTTAKPSPSTTRQQQLRAAVPPRTSGSQPAAKRDLSEEEAMLASYEGRL